MTDYSTYKCGPGCTDRNPDNTTFTVQLTDDELGLMMFAASKGKGQVSTRLLGKLITAWVEKRETTVLPEDLYFGPEPAVRGIK